MTDFVGFLERYSELLSFLTSFLMLVVTAIYVYFTRKQAKSAQDAFLATVMHFKESKQPCIVPSIKRVKGCAFDASKYIRIQFTFNYQLDNVGDTPALSIYTIASMQLKYSQKENVVFAHLMPNYKHVIPVNSKVEDNFHFETEEFRSILEDIQISHIKNLKRIETDPSKPPYRCATLRLDIYYKNMQGQWYQTTMDQDLLDIQRQVRGEENSQEISKEEKFEYEDIDGQIINSGDILQGTMINPAYSHLKHKKIDEASVVAIIEKCEHRLD